MTPDTLFRIASSTKMLTAAAVVMLAEQGHVRLHSPVGQHVPGLSRRLAALTLHQLLSHTAGLRDGFSFFGPHDDEALGRFCAEVDGRLADRPARRGLFLFQLRPDPGRSSC